MIYSKFSHNRRWLSLLMSIVMIITVIGVLPATVSAEATSTLYGYRVNYGGSGTIDMRWKNSELGNSWAEGEWVPYQLVITDIQEGGLTLEDMQDIVVEYDFYDSGKEAVLVDLVRGFQVKWTEDTDITVTDFQLQDFTNNDNPGDQGWPSVRDVATGGKITDTEFSEMEFFQNNTYAADTYLWDDFASLIVPENQINKGEPTPTGTTFTFDDLAPTDPFAYFWITKDQLEDVGVPQTADTIVLYFELHLARTSLWSSGLYRGYGDPGVPAYDWGGWIYGTEAFSEHTAFGSGYYPGASGQARLVWTGARTVSIPNPEQPVASVEGYKWQDDNQNHVKDESEDFIDGWPVYISAEIDGMAFVLGTLTGTTGPADNQGNRVPTPGYYAFPNLTYGWRYITEAEQLPGDTGWLQSTPFSGTAESFDVTETYTSGVLGTFLGTPSGDGYEDYFNSSDLDYRSMLSGDPITGDVELAGTGYKLNLEAPYPGHDEETQYQKLDINFGNLKYATKTGMKFEDLDGDGSKDEGDTGIPGWTIKRYLIGEGDVLTLDATTTTDEDGVYIFEDMMPGTRYFIAEDISRENWEQSYPHTGVTGAAYFADYGWGWDVTLTSGQVDSGNDFGNWEYATKTGKKFEDMDADGVKEEGDSGISGWTINRYTFDAEDNLVLDDTTTTDSSGNYSFDDMVPGVRYFIAEDISDPEWTQSYPHTGVSGALYIEGYGWGWDVTLNSAQTHGDNDFGNWQYATKSGIKFEDMDADGVADTDELENHGLAGWTIYADLNGDSDRDEGEPYDVTDADGAYSLTLRPHSAPILIREENQPDWTNSFPALGYYSETFESGDDSTNNHFGNWQYATKSGIKFEDIDADGVADSGELTDHGLSGWTIFADLDGNGALDPEEPYDITDEDGAYSLTIKPRPAAILIREVDQAGWTGSFPAAEPDNYYSITFTSGMVDDNNHFGNFQPATKTGIKFEDLDADGVLDAGEPAIEGWTIYRYIVTIIPGTDGQRALTADGSTLTDEDGIYLFDDMVPGVRYFIAEELREGWNQSYPNGTTGGTAFEIEGEGWGYEIILTSGQVDQDNNFGNWRYATKSGMKFEDLDADGEKDEGEPGLSGWTIYVDIDGSGTFNAGDLSDETDENGDYEITGIIPGIEYTIREVLKPGWTNTYPEAGFYTETFVSGNESSDNDFGNWYPAKKSGMKFEDLNADGVKDPGEPGLSGWTIYVDVDGSGTFNAGDLFDVTDEDGNYEITGITPGIEYTIREVLKPDWTNSYPEAGFYTETFESSEVATGNDFGNWYPAKKSGMKFEDLDADGEKDPGEPGLSNWTIYVDIDGSGTFNAGDLFDVTDENGNYEITGITPGIEYTIREYLKAGWTNSYPEAGFYTETFESSEVATGNDFGNWYPAKKSGMKFEDLDADGVKDLGEPGLSDWTIYVDVDDSGTFNGGDLFDVTDEDGNYEITGITPGIEYTIREVLKPDWTNSYPEAGFYTETFESSEVATGNDFGNYQMATKSGMKFNDLDRDGEYDAGEPGLSGWIIKLWTGTPENLELVASTTTDADGNYIFDKLIMPGITHYVSEVIPDPIWIQTYPNETTVGATYIAGLGYVWQINLTSGQIDSGNNFGNVYYHDETAWAYDPAIGKAIPFTIIPNKPALTNWGWTNGPYTLGMIEAAGEDGYVLDLYAGAGNNVLANGELVGHVTLSVEGGKLRVHYTMIGNNVLDEIHLWVGSSMLPIVKGNKYTNAPGQFPYDMADFMEDGTGGYYIDLTVDRNFYVAAHAVVRMYEIVD
ncbi:MAG: SdrD B-like domain-containing protein [Eubacteriales bacterium]|nr:SdrD B-like domain-containing protein [Eubacteriales bacterium]